MSWIHRLGRYSGYKATNYVPRKPRQICKVTLKNEIEEILSTIPHIPNVINGIKYFGNNIKTRVSPGFDNTEIYNYSYLSKSNYDELHSFYSAKTEWKNMPVDERLAIFERIADLVENNYYYKMMAATMVGQGKNLVEAELDCIAETVDFLRFNIQYTAEIMKKQPIGEHNYSQYLPLQGRVASITPFNFTAIAANLSTAPLYFGNVVYWKPSEKSLLSNYLYYNICLEAGVPAEILNFVIMEPNDYLREVVRKKTGGILFTGSTDGFTNVLSQVNYKEQFPRIMGETGGKNFHFVDETADLDLVVEKTYQSAYGYAGQKCSACSILYLPDIMLNNFVKKFKHYHNQVHPSEKEQYCLIDDVSYNNAVDVIESSKNNTNLNLLMGGSYSNESGYYVEPTLYRVQSSDKLMTKELFAPILLVKTYSPIFKNLAVLECGNNSEYKLTGAIFSKDNNFINQASTVLDGSCGNFYINDKSTGSVVGQQPFGGFGKSGTNDKAGDINFMMRLFNQRNIKENV
jgi:1-pyrroline-5-carboxylate dehydrogenase